MANKIFSFFFLVHYVPFGSDAVNRKFTDTLLIERGNCTQCRNNANKRKKLFKGFCCFLRPLTSVCFYMSTLNDAGILAQECRAKTLHMLPFLLLLFAIFLCYCTKSMMGDCINETGVL